MAKSLPIESEETWLKNVEIFQQIANENYFLRYMELDDPTDFVSLGNRRQSKRSNNDKPPPGRTLFTITKRLQRTPELEDFGFSLVWTQPPIIERIEPESIAEKCGLLAGDSIIFIDKQNVVTAPKLDILNLIKQQNTLTLEIFRRNKRPPVIPANLPALPIPPVQQAKFFEEKEIVTIHNPPAIIKQTSSSDDNESTNAPLCRLSSQASIETKKRLHLVTFSKESIIPQTTDNQRKKFLYQLIQCEQNFVTGMNFGLERFVQPLKQRRDLITFQEHDILFQNIEDIKFLSETILEQIIQSSCELNVNTLANIYVKKTGNIHSAYKKYCLGLKHANFVLVDKLHNTNYEFTKFITEPNIPRKCPDLTTFIHKPLHHFRDILKIFQMIASYCHIDSKEYDNLQKIITEFQSVYREITTEGMLEPTSDGKPPLLTLQDLESRLVFTKCKPFKLAIRGRQWIFGGDLIRMDGSSLEKPYWTLLFSDIIVFAKISRDRVLFITEEPIQIADIIESCFTFRKKTTEFRLTIEPNRSAQSPTVHCGPDLTRSPLRLFKRRTIALKAPTVEMKAVWQNLLTRQIFNINTISSTPLSMSPIDSPSITGNIGALTTSMASMKLSLESINNQRNQKPSTSNAAISDDNILQINDNFRSSQNNSILSHYKNFRSISTIGSISELPEIAMSSSTKHTNTSNQLKTLSDEKTDVLTSSTTTTTNHTNKIHSISNLFERKKSSEKFLHQQKAFDLGDFVEEAFQQHKLEMELTKHKLMQKEDERFEAIAVEKEDSAGYSSLNTPETPSANLSLSLTTTNDATKYSQNSLSFTSSIPPSILISPVHAKSYNLA